MAINTDPDIHNVVLVANMIIRKEEKFLVLKRSPLKRFWPNVIQPVGGKIDLEEDPYIGVLREVKEESGLTVKNVKLIANFHEVNLDTSIPRNWIAYYFIGDYESGELTECEEGEFLLLTKEELLSQKLSTPLATSLKEMLELKDNILLGKIIYDVNGAIIESTLHRC